MPTNDEIIGWFQKSCYCGFLKKMDAPVSLCIYCKTLSEFLEKDFLTVGVNKDFVAEVQQKATRCKKERSGNNTEGVK